MSIEKVEKRVQKGGKNAKRESGSVRMIRTPHVVYLILHNIHHVAIISLRRDVFCTVAGKYFCWGACLVGQVAKRGVQKLLAGTFVYYCHIPSGTQLAPN